MLENDDLILGKKEKKNIKLKKEIKKEKKNLKNKKKYFLGFAWIMSVRISIYIYTFIYIYINI